MNIYIMDPETLDRLAIINDYSARNWNRVWGEDGNFTIWAPLTEENEEFFVAENLVWPDDQENVGVIETIHKYTDEYSKLAQVEISGRFIASSYLSRRIVWGNMLLRTGPARVIRSLITTHGINPTDSNRSFGSKLGTTMSIVNIPTQDSITYCNSYGNLWEEVKNLALIFGFHVEFRYRSTSDTQTLSGAIIGGYDRTSTVILSTDLGFLTDSDYLWNSTDYCNTALIAGEGEGADRITAAIIPASATQRQRRELYVDARDLQKNSASTENPMSDEEYNAALLQRGDKKLLDHPLYESYECSLQLTGEEGYVFGKDYNLGDIITLTDNILKVQVQARVKEHLISDDKDGRIDTLVFGLSVPTITSLVKRRD